MLLSLANLVTAMPQAPSAKNRQMQASSEKRPFYHHKAKFNVKAIRNANSIVPADLQRQAERAILADFGIPKENLAIKSSHTVRASSHVYFHQVRNGVVFENHNCAVHFAGSQVSSTSCTPVSSQKGPTACTWTLDQCVKAAQAEISAPRDSIPHSQRLYELPNGSVVMVYSFQLKKDMGFFGKVSVDCNTGKLVDVVSYSSDYSSKMTYSGLNIPKQNALSGFAQEVNPENALASPEGWNVFNNSLSGTTQGNNARVLFYQITANGWSPSQPLIDPGYQITGTGVNQVLNGKLTGSWNAAQDPRSTTNSRISTINLFFLVNKFHDITYQYGFTEAAGNFQENNYGRGGFGGDGVLALNQHPGSINNAAFSTPPDGQRPTMYMFLWTLSNPQRDSSMDAGVVFHELTHGMSSRLTGGKADGRCLESNEARSLGEGWSDAVAMFLLRKASDTRSTDFAMGWYLLNQNSNGNGIRRYKYSSNTITNPHLYSTAYLDLSKFVAPHLAGEVWATVLNEMYWNLVNLLGFSTNWYNATQLRGNIVALRLVIAGMKRQPCNPTFLQARDAILQAGTELYAGAYNCQIWRAFAKRGLGIGALDITTVLTVNGTANSVNSFNIPATC
jgi:Zn-dependent metalloprotease